MPLPSAWKRRLRELDAALGLAEKITPRSIESFMAKVEDVLVCMPATSLEAIHDATNFRIELFFGCEKTDNS